MGTFEPKPPYFEPRIGAKSRYCPGSSILWPLEYKVCPICQEATVASTLEPIEASAARKLALETAFGWWLIAHGRF